MKDTNIQKSIRFNEKELEKLDNALEKFEDEEGLEGESNLIKWLINKYQLGMFDQKQKNDDYEDKPKMKKKEKFVLDSRIMESLQRAALDKSLCPNCHNQSPLVCDCMETHKTMERLHDLHGLTYNEDNFTEKDFNYETYR